LVALTFAGVAVGVSLTLTPKYEATTTILIGQAQGSAIPTAGSLQGEAQGLQQITQTMTEIVRSRTVAETAIQQLGLQTTAGAVKANLNSEQVRATQIIRVSYRDTDPERAQQVANAVGDVFSEQISELSPSANAVTATVLDRAQLPQEPVTPDTQRNGLLALGIGVMLGIALVLLLEYLNDSWRSPEEAEQVSGVPALSAIPVGTQRQAKTNDLTQRLVTVLEPYSASAEAYRTLRTSLLHPSAGTPPKAVVVTSHGSGEGKSTTCANLGVVLSQAGKRVLILDCDLRRPIMHKIFGLVNLWGIVDILTGEYTAQEASEEPVEGLQVISIGSVPHDPAELLDSQRFAEFLASVREEYDHVLIDAPPIGLVSDAAILATQGDGVLLVLDMQNTRKGDVRRSVRSLEAVNADIVGTVLYNAPVKEAMGGYYNEATPTISGG
jgi:capsular exopolysaccharide synthesis family protein